MVNKFIFTGYMTDEPRLVQTNTGNCTSFSVAVAGTKKDASTDFFRVFVGSPTADFVLKYLHKGSFVYVEGAIHNHNYTDTMGVKHYEMNFNAFNVQSLDRKPQAQDGPQITAQYQQPLPY